MYYYFLKNKIMSAFSIRCKIVDLPCDLLNTNIKNYTVIVPRYCL